MTNDEKILEAVGKLADNVASLAAGQQEMQKTIAKLDERMDGMEGHMESMQQDISTLKADVSTLKGDVAELKTMQEGIWQDIALHDEKIADVKKDTEVIRAAVAVNTLDIEDLRLAR